MNERLDDASALRKASDYLAGSPAAKVSQHEIRAVFDERIYCVGRRVHRSRTAQRTGHICSAVL